MSILNCKSLREVESLLSSKLDGISIISEVPVAKSELYNIERLYKELFSGSNKQQQSFINNVWKQYPVSSLIATVYIGIYYYDGNYWGHFISRIGCTNDQAWKECFLIEIERRNLFVFDIYGSMRYVSTILGHAGVPQNSFEGFFNGFIKPAFESGMSAEEALLCLKDEDEVIGTGIRPHLIHKGVKDYLRTGGKVAEDFVSRCLHMLTVSNDLLDEYHHILPRRILKLFKDWKKNSENLVISKDREKARIKSPEAKFDPYSCDIFLNIPVQQIKNHKNELVLWRIYCEGTEETIVECDAVHLRSVGEYQFIPRHNRLNLLPNKRYEIHYELNNVSVRVWKLHMATPLIFDKSSQRLLTNHLLTSSEQWLVLPNEYKLNQSQKIYATNEPMRNEWRNYWLWDIHAEVRTLLTFSVGSSIQTIAVAAETDKAYLRSVSNKVEWHDKERITFIDWPVLCVPANSFISFRKEYSHWRLQLIHTFTETKSEYELSNISEDIKLVGNYYEIPLSLLQLEQEAGHFKVNLLTGLGSDIKLSFNKLPSSFSLEQAMPIFPVHNGMYEEQNIKFLVPSPYILTCVSPSNVVLQFSISDINEHSVYRMKVPKKVDEVNLQLYNPRSGELCPLKLVTKALSWELLEEREIKCMNESIKLTDQYLVEHSKSLRIAIDGSNLSCFSSHEYKNSYNLTLRLTDHDGNQLTEKQRKLRQNHVFTMDINWILETIQSVDVPLCRLWLEVEHLMVIPFVVLEINKQWIVSNIYSEITDDNSLIVKWNESSAVTSRKLIIWDEWHPWKGKEEYSIPDGEYQLTIRNWSEKEKGSYLFEWYINTDDGMFSFLHEQVYPDQIDNTWRLISKGHPYQNNPLGDLLIGRECKGNAIVLKESHFNELLNGLWAYGEHYILNQIQNNISIWRSFGKKHHEQLIQYLNYILRTLETNQRNWIYLLLGIEEWPITEIIKIESINMIGWKSIGDIRPENSQFGKTRDSISNLIYKPSEELNQLRQFIPPLEGIFESFNIPNLIISFMLTCKINSNYRQNVNELIISYRNIYFDLVESWKNQSKYLLLLPLLESRWEPLDEPIYSNYPYFVAITAAGLRIQARSQQPNRVITALREFSISIRALTPGWLEHDLMFLESVLLRMEEEKI